MSVSFQVFFETILAAKKCQLALTAASFLLMVESFKLFELEYLDWNLIAQLSFSLGVKPG